MEEKPILRILNKKKEGVTVLIGVTPKEMSWDEFNSIYVMTEDKKHCTLTDEAWKLHMEGMDLVVKCVAATFIVERSTDPKIKFTNQYIVGDLIHKIAEHFGCSIIEAMQLVAKHKTSVEREMLPNFSSPRKRFEKKTPEEIFEEKKKDEMMSRGTVYTATQSMSDVKGMDELKKKFNIK